MACNGQAGRWLWLAACFAIREGMEMKKWLTHPGNMYQGVQGADAHTHFCAPRSGRGAGHNRHAIAIVRYQFLNEPCLLNEAE